MESLAQFAQKFQALGSEPRLQIYIALLQHEPNGLNVKELQSVVNMKASTLSHHLKMLVDSGFVQQEQHGKESINHAVAETLRSLCKDISCKCCELTVDN